MSACPDDAVHGCLYPSIYPTAADFLSLIVIGVTIGVAVVGARFIFSKLFKRRRRQATVTRRAASDGADR